MGGIVGGVAVGPLFHFDETGAVVEFVGCVCVLGLDLRDLAYEGYCADFGGVDYEVCVGVGAGAVFVSE